MASTSSHPQLPAASGGPRELRWIRAVSTIPFLLAVTASVALLFIPYYGNVQVGADSGPATLIQVNGSGVVIAFALPVLLTAVIALARGRRSLLISALCTVLLAVFVAFAIASIGMFYLPALLAAAVDVLARALVTVVRSRVSTSRGRPG